MKNKIRTYVCKGCGKTVVKSCMKTVKFCSEKCYHKHGKTGRKKTGRGFICEACGKDFYLCASRIIRATRFYCSRSCANNGQNKKIELVCKVCNETFIRSPSFKNQKYCSFICRNNDPEYIARIVKAGADQNKNLTPNKFEKLAYSVLDELEITYEPQYFFNKKFTVDAFIKDKSAVIQFDGDYWHGNPKKYKTLDHRQKKRVALDCSQDAYMKKVGVRVFRFWQSDFIDIDSVKKTMLSI